MTREEMWKEFEKQLIRETRTPITVSYDVSEKMTKSAIERTVAKWKERLEQEQFINKPCVSSGVCEQDKNVALDKIRAEIENIDPSYYSSVNGVDMTECADDIKHGMLEIIDKYKAEIEPQERSDKE